MIMFNLFKRPKAKLSIQADRESLETLRDVVEMQIEEFETSKEQDIKQPIVDTWEDLLNIDDGYVTIIKHLRNVMASLNKTLGVKNGRR